MPHSLMPTDSPSPHTTTTLQTQGTVSREFLLTQTVCNTAEHYEILDSRVPQDQPPAYHCLRRLVYELPTGACVAADVLQQNIFTRAVDA